MTRIFGCIPGSCVFLLLCNRCVFIKFTDLIFKIYEFDDHIVHEYKWWDFKPNTEILQE